MLSGELRLPHMYTSTDILWKPDAEKKNITIIIIIILSKNCGKGEILELAVDSLICLMIIYIKFQRGAWYHVFLPPSFFCNQASVCFHYHLNDRLMNRLHPVNIYGVHNIYLFTYKPVFNRFLVKTDGLRNIPMVKEQVQGCLSG